VEDSPYLEWYPSNNNKKRTIPYVKWLRMCISYKHVQCHLVVFDKKVYVQYIEYAFPSIVLEKAL